MKYINKFNTTNAFEEAKNALDKLKHYIVYLVDSKKILLKDTTSYFILNVKDADLETPEYDGESIKIFEIINNDGEQQEKIHVLPISLNKNIKCIGFPYGFRFQSKEYVLSTVPNPLYCLNSIDVSHYDTSKIIDASGMFAQIQTGSDFEIIGINSLNTSNMTNMSHLFNCSDIASIDLNNWDASHVTNMACMFANCQKLTDLKIDKLNVSKVTNMLSMFENCSKLTSLDLSNWNTSNVTNMNGMFSSCYKLTSLDLSNWNTSNVTNMSYMFFSCGSLTSLDLSNFDASSVVSKNYMFWTCNQLNYIKCKQEFKDWCITNQSKIYLPSAMQDGGGGTWDIVDA